MYHTASYIGKVKVFIKSRLYVSAAIVLVVAAAGYLYFSGGEESVGETVIVKKGDVVQEVSVTGKVKPVTEVDLSFEKSGKIARINANIGGKVSAGELLISLENSDLSASLAQAKAQLKIDEVKLTELLKGTREEDIEIKRAELQKAKQDLENYHNDIVNTLNNSYVTADDAARVKTSGIFSGYRTTSYQLTYISCSASEPDAEFLRLKSEDELDKWKAELNLLSGSSPKSELENALIAAKNHLAVVNSLMDKTGDTLVTGCTINDSSLDNYRKNISTAKTNIVSVMSDIDNLEQNIAAQKITVLKTESELNLKLAGSTEEQINAQKAQVDYSRARVASAEAELAKTIIRAPFGGTVTKQDGKLGAVVSASAPIVSVISEAQFEIETFIPEADITKIKVGDVARVTLDAYGSDVVFEAVVALIPPSETIIEGVPTYKTTFKFTKESDLIKSGMTANIDIETDKKNGVLVLPQRSVIKRGDEALVSVVRNGEVFEVPVAVGLRGSFGEVEVLSGLNEGDAVLLFAK